MRRRLDVMAAVGTGQGHPSALDARDALGVQMLAYQIDGRHEQAAGPGAFIERMQRHPSIAAELVEFTALLQARTTLAANPSLGWKTRRCACMLPMARARCSRRWAG